MARATAASKPPEPVTQSPQQHEAVDPAVYDGWDFDELNREARRIRRMEREKGHDAVVSSSRGCATAVARRDA